MTCRNGLKNSVPARAGSPFAGRGQQVQSGTGEGGFELAAVVVAVCNDDLSDAPQGQVGVGVEDLEQALALVGLGAGQGESDREPVQRADQVQPQSPEEPGVAGAVAVLGPSGQIGTFRGLAAASALITERIRAADRRSRLW